MSGVEVSQPGGSADSSITARIAMVGNPNTGKTTLFNALTGLRAKTANYPGITVDLRRGQVRLPGMKADLIDLPGLYSLDALSPEERVAEDVLRGKLGGEAQPDVVLLVVDATNLERNLFLVSEILDLRLPTVIAINLIDAAESAGIKIETERLASELNCPVVPVSARTGSGLRQLKQTLSDVVSRQLPILAEEHTSCTFGCTGCTFAARFDWAQQVSGCTVQTPATHGQQTAAIDRVLTNPVMGVVAFLSVMLSVFYLIFSLASVPMTLVDKGFSRLAEIAGRLVPTAPVQPIVWFATVFFVAMSVFAAVYWIARIRWTRKSSAASVAVSVFVAMMPVEEFRSLLINGVIGGVGGVVIFLPQICILFFFISLLEDSGYMARAAFVMERLMRFVGLPGKAFVPMLSAHACAIPGIMATRVIEDWRDRLVTILVLPLLTCSARLPVYAMITALLFSDSPLNAALVFTGAYMLGIAAALASAYCLKKTILKGDTVPLIIELPPYRRPSLRVALTTVLDRGMSFVRQAGTVILLISVILWALASYPRISEDLLSEETAAQVAALRTDAAVADGEAAEALSHQADLLVAREGLAYSAAGRIGRLMEPVFAPLGFDWKINIAVISSFAAREVVVSTLAIVYGIGEEEAQDPETLVETLRRQKRPDGTPVFTTATGLSLLVFFVLAMQCLPTQAVTRRETGSWKWPVFQLVYMTVLAYTAALIVYQGCVAAGLD